MAILDKPKLKYPKYKFNYDTKFTDLKPDDTKFTDQKQPSNFDSNADEESKLCRICYDDTVDSELISPCKCSGSIKWVHQSCLKKWVNTSKKDICPQCKFKYIKKTQYKLPKLKFLQKNIYVKLTTFIIISIFVTLFTLISFKFAKHNTVFFFDNIKIVSNLYHVYNGLKIFIILSLIVFITLHIKKIINLLNIIHDNNLNIGSNIIEFSYCIFIIYNDIIKFFLKKNNIINYTNYNYNE